MSHPWIRSDSGVVDSEIFKYKRTQSTTRRRTMISLRVTTMTRKRAKGTTVTTMRTMMMRKMRKMTMSLPRRRPSE